MRGAPAALEARAARCYSRAMRMRNAAWLVLALIAGWGLGWLAREYSTPPPGTGRTAARVVPDVPSNHPRAGPPAPEVPPGRDETIRRLMENRDYARAVERYDALQARADEPTVQRARRELLDEARRLVAQAEYPDAIELLDRYLQSDYRDVEAHLLRAEAAQGAGDLRAAIGQLYEAKGQAWRAETLEDLDRRIRAVVAAYADALQRRGDSAGLLALYQDLTQLEPGYAPYFIGLATAQLALDDPGAARQSLLLVAQDPDVGARARELLARLRPTAAGVRAQETPAPAGEVSGIPLMRSGNHFLVDARLGSRSARLLIDTGASLTMLTPAALGRRGDAAHETGRTGIFNTANGRVRAPIYRLDALSVGDWQVSDLEVGVLDLDNPGIDGLLGMNFLSRFRFFIDQNEALLRLSPAAGR
jgi:clan AA aspartic protease (TIGR02281 family)